MTMSRHEKAIRAELEAVETELVELTAEADSTATALQVATSRWELLQRLLDTPAGNGEEAT